eukprot:6461938-Prymnesium_polylepis.1
MCMCRLSASVDTFSYLVPFDHADLLTLSQPPSFAHHVDVSACWSCLARVAPSAATLVRCSSPAQTTSARWHTAGLGALSASSARELQLNVSPMPSRSAWAAQAAAAAHNVSVPGALAEPSLRHMLPRA